jgi:hypothetical protein
MTQEVYLEILASHFLPFGLNRYGSNWILHQDNDPKHNSYLCANFLKENEINWVNKNKKYICYFDIYQITLVKETSTSIFTRFKSNRNGLG